MQRPTDRCLSTMVRPLTAKILGLAADMFRALSGGLRLIGGRTINAVWRMGSATRFMGLVMLRSGLSFRRFQLPIDELHFPGVLSLLFLILSGLFSPPVPCPP